MLSMLSPYCVFGTMTLTSEIKMLNFVVYYTTPEETERHKSSLIFLILWLIILSIIQKQTPDILRHGNFSVTF